MNEQQKFRRGNLVKIADDLGEWMRHFTSGVEAIIDHSYADKYGASSGRDYKTYSVMFLNGNTCAWYYEDQLTLVEEGGEHLIEKVTREREAREQVESDMDWIVRNWERIHNGPISHATISTLMRAIGITNPWGARGEGVTLYENQMFTIKSLDAALTTGIRETADARIKEVREWLATQPDPYGCRSH